MSYEFEIQEYGDGYVIWEPSCRYDIDIAGLIEMTLEDYQQYLSDNFNCTNIDYSDYHDLDNSVFTNRADAERALDWINSRIVLYKLAGEDHSFNRFVKYDPGTSHVLSRIIDVSIAIGTGDYSGDTRIKVVKNRLLNNNYIRK